MRYFESSLIFQTYNNARTSYPNFQFYKSQHANLPNIKLNIHMRTMPSKNSPQIRSNHRHRSQKKIVFVYTRANSPIERNISITPSTTRFNASDETLPQTFSGRQRFNAKLPSWWSTHHSNARHSAIARTKIPFTLPPRSDRPKRRFHLRIFINDNSFVVGGG